MVSFVKIAVEQEDLLLLHNLKMLDQMQIIMKLVIAPNGFHLPNIIAANAINPLPADILFMNCCSTTADICSTLKPANIPDNITP